MLEMVIEEYVSCWTEERQQIMLGMDTGVYNISKEKNFKYKIVVNRSNPNLILSNPNVID